jgi:hypothetical protein
MRCRHFPAHKLRRYDCGSLGSAHVTELREQLCEFAGHTHETHLTTGKPDVLAYVNTQLTTLIQRQPWQRVGNQPCYYTYGAGQQRKRTTVIRQSGSHRLSREDGQHASVRNAATVTPCLPAVACPNRERSGLYPQGKTTHCGKGALRIHNLRETWYEEHRRPTRLHMAAQGADDVRPNQAFLIRSNDDKRHGNPLPSFLTRDIIARGWDKKALPS